MFLKILHKLEQKNEQKNEQNVITLVREETLKKKSMNIMFNDG